MHFSLSFFYRSPLLAKRSISSLLALSIIPTAAISASLVTSTKFHKLPLLPSTSNQSKDNRAKMATTKMYVKKITDQAYIPTKGSKYAAGFDLYSAYDYVVKSQDKELVKTDLMIQVPEGTYGRVAPRSGLAVKHFIDVGAGVIDRDYRGNVGIVLFNFGKTDFVVKKGDKVAQLVLEKICEANAEEVDELQETERGEGGFGSTGVSTTSNTAASELEAKAKRLKTDDSAPVEA